MAWKHYPYLRLVRGLTPPEFRVLTFLVDEADLYGTILALESKTIGVECEVAQNTVFRILRRLQDKKFISARIGHDAPDNGRRISNGYKLDFGRYFPAGETQGAAIWKTFVRKLGDGAKVPAANSEAFYSIKSKNLTVWVDGLKEQKFFQQTVLRSILNIARSHDPEIRYFDFIIKVPPRA